MEYRTTIFYIALVLIIGCLAEFYVRLNGIGEQVEKVRGVVVSKKPKLGPPVVLLIISIVVAVLTIPR
jgi:hypothetical protein